MTKPKISMAMIAAVTGLAVMSVFSASIIEATGVNAKDHFGQTALTLASKEGKADIVRALLAKAADINPNNNDGNTTAVRFNYV